MGTGTREKAGNGATDQAPPPAHEGGEHDHYAQTGDALVKTREEGRKTGYHPLVEGDKGKKTLYLGENSTLFYMLHDAKAPATWTVRQTAGEHLDGIQPEVIEQSAGSMHENFLVYFTARAPGFRAFDTSVREDKEEAIVDGNVFKILPPTVKFGSIRSEAHGKGREDGQTRSLPVTHEAQLGEEIIVDVELGGLGPWTPQDLRAKYTGGLEMVSVRKISATHAEVVMTATKEGDASGQLGVAMFDTPASQAELLKLQLNIRPMSGLHDYGGDANDGKIEKDSNSHGSEGSSKDDKKPSSPGRPRDLNDAIYNQFIKAQGRLHDRRADAIDAFTIQTTEKDPPKDEAGFQSLLEFIATTVIGSFTAGVGARFSGFLMHHLGHESEGVQEIAKVMTEESMNGAIEYARSRIHRDSTQRDATAGYGRSARFIDMMKQTLNGEDATTGASLVTNLGSVADSLEKEKPGDGVRLMMAAREQFDAEAVKAAATQLHLCLEGWSTLVARESVGTAKGKTNLHGLADETVVESRKNRGDAANHVPLDPLDGPEHAEGVLSIETVVVTRPGVDTRHRLGEARRYQVHDAKINGLRNQGIRDQLKGGKLTDWKIPMVISNLDEEWVFTRDEQDHILMEERSRLKLSAVNPKRSELAEARAILDQLVLINPIDIDGDDR